VINITIAKLLVHIDMKDFLLLLFLSLIIASCDSEPEVKAPDVSEIEVEVNINRFDQAISKSSISNPETAYLNLLSKYPIRE